LAHDLAETLVTDIIDGVYPPQSTLPSEQELAQISGVSRLTVREAVKSLSAKSVLRVEHGRGTFVNPPDQWSPLDPVLLVARSLHNSDRVTLPKKLLEARHVVEIAVAGFAAVRRTDDHLEQMHHALERMQQAHEQTDVEGFVQADMAFHQAIMAAADNPFITALFEPLEQVLLIGRRQTSAFFEERVHAIEKHGIIHDAISVGDPTAARLAMADHMKQTEEDFDAFVVDHGAVLDLPDEPRPSKQARPTHADK
jgi:DNA-binding FadR family transcriptional regulator